MNEIICGDCVQIMKEMKPESVGAFVISPPYNMGISPTQWGGKKRKFDSYDNHDDSMPEENYITWQRECLDSMMRLLKNNGAIFYNQKWRIHDGLLADTCDRITEGFPVRQIIIWDRNGGINHNDGWFIPMYEVIYLITKPDFCLTPKSNRAGDVWTVRPERKNKTHPAPFPLEIPLKCIKSVDADPILDPMCGSGTTCLAAKLLGRNYIGIDISEKYCKIARKRVAQESIL